MAKFKTESYIMPSYWASAIINNDYSGLDNNSTKQLNNYLLNNGLSFKDCLTVSDEFTGKFDGLICSVCTYQYKA